MRDEWWVMSDAWYAWKKWWMMSDAMPKKLLLNKSFWPSRTCSKTLCSMHGLHSASFFALSLDHATGSCTGGIVCKGIFVGKKLVKKQKAKRQSNNTNHFSDTTIHTKSKRQHQLPASAQPPQSPVQRWLFAKIGGMHLDLCTTCLQNNLYYIANTAKNPTKATIVSTYFANIHSAHIIQTMSMWSGMSTHWLCCPVLRPSFPPQPANIFCRRMMLQADTQGSASLSSLNPSANIRGASSLIN